MRRRLPYPPPLALGLALALVGCQASLPTLTARDAAPADAKPDAPPVDSSVDSSVDGADDADVGVDGPPPMPGLFDCAPPEQLTSAPPRSREPAFSADALRIYTKDLETGHYVVADRPGADEPFGDWQAAPAWVAPQLQDLDFYRDGATERYLAAIGKSDGSGRVIVDCPVGQSCTEADALKITLPPGISDLDIDGPNLAWPAGGPLLVFNAGPDANNHQVLLASRSGDTWTAETLTGVPGIKNDDPAISPDGRLVLLTAQAPGAGHEDLWLLRRAAIDQPFGSAEQLPAPVNSGGIEHGPDLAAVPGEPDRLELIFTSTREGGTTRLWRTTCSTVAPGG